MRKIILALALMLISASALAQSRVWISEFTTTQPSARAPFATLPSVVNQPTLDISVAGKRSGIFDPSTRYIRIVCEVQCAITAKGAATPSDILLPALKPEYFGVLPNTSIYVIAAP